MKMANFEMVLVTGTCEKHGDWESTGFVGKEHYADCPKCVTERTRRNEEIRQVAMRQETADRMLSNADIPKRYVNKRLSDFVVDDKNQKAADICQRYAAKINSVVDSGISLCFCGKPGTGKTHLATGIIHEAIKNQIDSRYVTTVQMIREVKSTYRKNSEHTESAVIKKFSTIPLLVLDEVGMQFGSDTEKLILSEIIDSRYGNVLPTIVISNLGIKELREYMGDRIIDRMREGGGAVISFDWDSKRGEL